MVGTRNSVRWWRLLVTVLFAGVLLPLFGMTARAHAAGGADAQAVALPAVQDDGGGDDDGDDDDEDDDEDGREFKGVVEVMPTGTLTGLWTISGNVYTVTEQTEIKQKYGSIEVGACVKGELSADATYVRELQSKRNVVCRHGDDDGGGDDGQGRGELYAKLNSFPPGLIGDWVIGSLTFKADANTEFDQKRGTFTEGEFVKVEFIILQDGTFLAKEIKTVSVAHDDDDDDGPGHGHDDDIEHHAVAFGVIDSLPASGTEGLWVIGGITYTVNVTTELEARHGAFEAGRNVRVKYWVDDAGNRIAKQIKSMPPAAGGNPQGVFKIVGFVQAMPADGFVGEWSVGGIILLADQNSKFEETKGLLAVGAYVEVTYRRDRGERRLLQMETHVMPGGGDDDQIGTVEQMDDSLAAADAAAGAVATTWRIGGRSYVVTDATMVGSVAQGDTVLVNSYTDTSGAQVATRISDVTLDNLLFLPAASR